MPREVIVAIDEKPASPEVKQSGDWLIENFFALTEEFTAWTAAQTQRVETLNLEELALPEMELTLLDSVGNTVFLEEYEPPLILYTEKPLQIAALLNLLASYKVSRKDKKPYTIHPMFVDVIVAVLSNLPPKDLLVARIFALIHDFIEEDTLRLIIKRITDPNAGCICPDFSLSKVENVRKAKEILNQIMPEYALGDVALEMMQPQLEEPDTVTYEYKHARFIHWLNWRAENSRFIRVVKLADKIHDLLDLDYITKNQNKTKEEKADSLANKLAKVYFSMYNLLHSENNTLHGDVPIHLWQVFLYIFKQRLDEFSIDTTSADGVFAQTLNTYQSHYSEKRPQMLSECHDYAKMVGLVTS